MPIQELRHFASELFGKTKSYYSLRDRRKENKTKLAILNEMRDDKELENFKEKQKKRAQEEASATKKGKVF